MIKLKELLKETLTWENRKFGERLPTLGDYKKLKEMGFDVFEDMFPDILVSLSHPDYEKRINYIIDQLTN